MTAHNGGADPAILLRRLIDNLPAMIAYWDTDCRNVVANSAYRDYFGIDPDQLKGAHISDVLGKDVYALNLPYIEGVLDGRPQTFERTLTNSRGVTRHTRASYVPDIAADGRTAGFFVLVTDITPLFQARKALERSVQQYRALAQHMPDSFILLYDENLTYTIADGPALTYFGQSSESMEGRTLHEVLPDRAEELEPRYRAALRGEVTSWDRELDGRTLSLTASPVYDQQGAIFAGLVVGRDVTLARRQQATDDALRRIAAATAQGESLQRIATMIGSHVRELFDADFGGVVRFQEGRIVAVSVVPSVETLQQGDNIRDSDGSALGQVAVTGRPAFTRYDEHSTGRALRLFRSGVIASAGAPIYVDGALWGAVALGVRDQQVDGDVILPELTRFADAAATSVSSSAAWETLRATARTDTLTELPNRRAFDEFLSRALHAAERLDQSVSLILLDVDRFKVINDTHGHPIGDAVLVAVAERMAAVSRNEELLARLGGDEFALVLPAGGPAEAQEAARRLQAAVAKRKVGEVSVTLSAGTATACRPKFDAASLIAEADSALYAYKRDERRQR